MGKSSYAFFLITLSITDILENFPAHRGKERYSCKQEQRIAKRNLIGNEARRKERCSGKPAHGNVLHKRYFLELVSVCSGNHVIEKSYAEERHSSSQLRDFHCIRLQAQENNVCEEHYRELACRCIVPCGGLHSL